MKKIRGAHCFNEITQILLLDYKTTVIESVAEKQKKKIWANRRLRCQKPERGYNCRNFDFAEAIVFRCLSGEIQPFGFCFEKRWLKNVIRQCDLSKSMTWYIDLETGIWANRKKCSERCRSGKKCHCKIMDSSARNRAWPMSPGIRSPTFYHSN